MKDGLNASPCEVTPGTAFKLASRKLDPVRIAARITNDLNFGILLGPIAPDKADRVQRQLAASHRRSESPP